VIFRTYSCQHLVFTPALTTVDTCGVGVNNHAISWFNECKWVDFMGRENSSQIDSLGAIVNFPAPEVRINLYSSHPRWILNLLDALNGIVGLAFMHSCSYVS
jgi:hypothetical protein